MPAKLYTKTYLRKNCSIKDQGQFVSINYFFRWNVNGSFELYIYLYSYISLTDYWNSDKWPPHIEPQCHYDIMSVLNSKYSEAESQ